MESIYRASANIKLTLVPLSDQWYDVYSDDGRTLGYGTSLVSNPPQVRDEGCPLPVKEVTATNPFTSDRVSFPNIILPIHWKQKAVHLTTLMSLVAPQVGFFLACCLPGATYTNLFAKLRISDHLVLYFCLETYVMTIKTVDVRWNCYSQIRYIKRDARKCNCVGYIVGLVQDLKNFIVNALDLLQTCTKPSICVWFWFEIKRLSSKHWSTQQGDWVLHVL